MRKGMKGGVATILLCCAGVAVIASASAEEVRREIIVQAVRITERPKIDGALDEEIYRDNPPISELVQVEPVFGAPASEPTDIWIFFDSDNIFIAAKCWDSHPERLMGNQMQRDANMTAGSDWFAVGLDT